MTFTGVGVVLYALAVWRLAHMLVKEDGPVAVLQRLRALDPSGIFSCVSCTSVWAAGLLLLAPRWAQTLLAGSAAAKLLEDYLYDDTETETPQSVEVPFHRHYDPFNTPIGNAEDGGPLTARRFLEER